MPDLNEITFLLAIEKAQAYHRLNQPDAAEAEYIRALDLALDVVNAKHFEDGIRLLEKFLMHVEQENYLKSMWGEVTMHLALCYDVLGNKSKRKKLWKRVMELEPENKSLRGIAVRRKWIRK
ncbi:MAG TPA: hypothetical protein VLL52_17720 [Anaerolineae bacterium]|nr:hypothetical protein [Anaerolineae bacterium]